MMYQPATSQIKLSSRRAHVLFGLLLLGLVCLVGRAAYLQGMDYEFLQKQGKQRYSDVVNVSAHRGKISDRNGTLLARSTLVPSVCANPQKIKITAEQLSQLAVLLKMDVAAVKKQFDKKHKQFVYLKRRLSQEATEKIVDLNIPGIFLQEEFKRFYPAGEVTAHVVGITNIDDVGQEGIEQGWQSTLAGEQGLRRVIRDNMGQIISDEENIRQSKQGQDLTLSLDRRIQYFAHSELKRAVELNKAKAGSIVVLDAQTGEVLAMTNFPVYNPNRKRTSGFNNEKARNRAVINTFEPGSTIKPFTVAAALEVGKITPNTIVQTAPGRFKVGNRVIRDVKDKGALTVPQIIQASSNIGVAKIALSLRPKTLWNMLNRSGFGVSTGSGFPGEASGKLRNYDIWKPIEQATISFGYGISTNLMQIARAYTLFTTGGELMPVSLVKQNVPSEGKRVISPDTAAAVGAMLEMVAQPDGTAPLAQVNGYRVAGKTGTAHKLIEGKYAKRYISTFVGYAPASNPRLITAVLLDEPSAGEYFGGTVAAPVFSQVMARALRALNVPHDAPANNIVRLPLTPTAGTEG